MNFLGKIEKGKFILNNREYFDLQIAKMPDCKASVEVKRIWNKRSLEQNSWYWGVILPLISETTGHTPNELDDIFEEMFAPKKIYKFKDCEIVSPKHCKELTTGEFVEFIERIRAEVASLGITIPAPEFISL